MKLTLTIRAAFEMKSAQHHAVDDAEHRRDAADAEAETMTGAQGLSLMRTQADAQIPTTVSAPLRRLDGGRAAEVAKRVRRRRRHRQNVRREADRWITCQPSFARIAPTIGSTMAVMPGAAHIRIERNQRDRDGRSPSPDRQNTTRSAALPASRPSTPPVNPS